MKCPTLAVNLLILLIKLANQSRGLVLSQTEWEITDQLVTHVYRERIVEIDHVKTIVKKNRASPTSFHDVIFVVRQKNLDLLKTILYDVSDSHSQNYGRHMTWEEIGDLTAAPDSAEQIKSFLRAAGASIVTETHFQEYITARGTIRMWEEMFDTIFYQYSIGNEEKLHKGSQNILRSEAYSVPISLDALVESVLNTVQMPTGRSQRSNLVRKSTYRSSGHSLSELTGKTTPAKLLAAYDIDSTVGSPRATQAVFETLNQSLSPSDLEVFQRMYNVPITKITNSVGDRHDQDKYCRDTPSNCAEASLDTQYLMAISQSPTTFMYYEYSTWSSWLTLVASMRNPPLVVSISYSSDEKLVGLADMQAFDVQAIKLGVMGVTLVASSGDWGVNSPLVEKNGVCSYTPLFPASCPYVLSIGATQVTTARTSIGHHFVNATHSNLIFIRHPQSNILVLYCIMLDAGY